jgi:hypothetical protein
MGNNGKNDLHSTAKMIREYQAGWDSEAMKGVIVSNYENLIRIIEDEEIERKVSITIQPIGFEIRESAQMLMDILLFNKDDDAYLSLGLPREVSKEKVRERWKRLILLYHPDRHANSKMFEERAKKINNAFAVINNAEKSNEKAVWQTNTSYPERKLTEPSKSELKKDIKPDKLFKRFSSLPAIILAVSALIALLMLSYCVYKVSSYSRITI